MLKVGKNKQKFWTSFYENFCPNFSNILRAKFKKFLDIRFAHLKNLSYTHTLQVVNGFFGQYLIDQRIAGSHFHDPMDYQCSYQ